MHGFVQRVQLTIADHALIERGARTVACVSGGPDSMAMLLALHALRVSPEVAFVDHGLRPEASTEGRFVETAAGRLGLRFHRLACEPTGPSEAAMRDARYAALATLGPALLATGHTASDQAETVLMRMIRGTGTTGLAAIPPRRDSIVRPLIRVTREEVLAYLTDRGQPFLTDPTNASLDPLRNRVRHVLLPLLAKDFQPRIVGALCRLADAARDERGFLEAAAAEHLETHGLARAALENCARGLIPHVLRKACPVPVPAERMIAMLRLIQGRGGAVQLEGGVIFDLAERGRMLTFRRVG